MPLTKFLIKKRVKVITLILILTIFSGVNAGNILPSIKLEISDKTNYFCFGEELNLKCVARDHSKSMFAQRGEGGV